MYFDIIGWEERTDCFGALGPIYKVTRGHKRLKQRYSWGDGVSLEISKSSSQRVIKYSKNCVKRPLKNRQNKDLIDKW